MDARLAISSRAFPERRALWVLVSIGKPFPRPTSAGILPNNRENLIRWIKSAREVSPRTAMPSTGLTDREAGQIADYLYSL